MKTAADFKHVVLRDDDTGKGGTAFVGETLGDFINEELIDEDTPMDEINTMLAKCGIKTIETS